MPTTRTLALVAMLLAGLAPSALPAQASRGALTRGTLAVTNVSVVPMTSDTVLRDATVVVRDGRIVAVGPAGRVRVPWGARRIDGRGKFLIPGLADMHTHLYSDDSAPESVAPDELGVMVANGLTAVRLMIGTPNHLRLRSAIETGTVLGPQLWVASPMFQGRAETNARVVATPEEARTAVDEVQAAGYDFIKLALFITPDVFDAIVAAAATRRVPLVGHVDARVGVARALAAGQHIEHLDNYMESVLADSATSRLSVSDRGVFRAANWASLDHVDDRKVDAIAGATARSGTFTTPTLTMFKTAFAQGQSDSVIRARPDWQVMTPSHRAGYLAANERYWRNPPSEARRRRYVEVRNHLVKAIADSGGAIMAGSDTPEWFHVYGFALHRELQSLVEAGLSPYQALAAATTTPARFLNASAEWGTIEAGKRADFVLLGDNPLQDIRHTTRIEAVSLGGRYLERAALDQMIRSAAERVSGPAPGS